MTKEERAKIVFEETHKVLGDDMACLALMTLGIGMLYGKKDAQEKLKLIRFACAKREVSVDE